MSDNNFPDSQEPQEAATEAVAPVPAGEPVTSAPVAAAAPAAPTPAAAPATSAQPDSAAPGSLPAAAPAAQTVPPVAAPAPAKSSKGFAIAALVLGIVAILTVLFAPLSITCGVLAVIFGIVALVKKQSKGLGVTGLVLGSVGALVSVIIVVSLALAVSHYMNNPDELDKQIAELQEEIDDNAAADAENIVGIEDESGNTVGTADSPLSLDYFIDDNFWKFSFNEVVLDANAEVAAADSANLPPEQGMVYIRANATVKRLLADAGDNSLNTVVYVAADGTEYDPVDLPTIPAPDFWDADQIVAGGKEKTGNLIFEVPSELDGVLKVVLHGADDSDDSLTVYFKLQ